MKIFKVLTIAGSDSGGGAGIQADLKTVTAMGCYGMSVITALTAQNTLGVQGIMEVPLDFIGRQFDSVLKDIGADAAKTGMLANSGIIKLVSEKIREYKIQNLVVDPVMVAKGGASLLADDAKTTLIQELIPLSLVVTPNIPEAEVLANISISSLEDMKKAAQIIYDKGAKNVLVKGGHLDNCADDVLYDGKEFRVLSSERIITENTHGTGCTFSAAIAAGLAAGKPVYEAAAAAKEYITTAIRYSLSIGGGHGPTNHFASAIRSNEKYNCISSLKKALQVLTDNECGNIIPEVQSNLGYALPFADNEDHVAAFPGRIIKIFRDVLAVKDPDFGSSRHIAHIIITAMKYSPEYRSAMNIKYSEKIINICRDLNYKIDSFDRRDEPGDIKTREGSSLEWGTGHVLSNRNDVPDIIFDTGDTGKEPMIRILGKDPAEVTGKALKISEKLRKEL